MSLRLGSLEEEEQIERTDTNTLADMSMRALKCVVATLSRRTHLQDISIAKWESEGFDLQVGYHVPRDTGF